jgi:hypothetical protein
MDTIEQIPDSKFDNWKTRATIVSLVIILWGLSWLCTMWYYKTAASAGPFGDLFGAVNSLFSGLAFGGIIYYNVKS